MMIAGEKLSLRLVSQCSSMEFHLVTITMVTGEREVITKVGNCILLLHPTYLVAHHHGNRVSFLILERETQKSLEHRNNGYQVCQIVCTTHGFTASQYRYLHSSILGLCKKLDVIPYMVIPY